jgi:alpha-mannosidase
VDGSEVLAYRPTDGYTHEIGRGIEKIERELVLMADEGMDLMAFWGVGDHGGGASAAELEALRRLAAAHPETAVRHSHPQAYFESIAGLREQLPVIVGDLQKSFTGCYTSGAYVKRAHRQAEGLLAQAERLATVAHARAGLPYPAAELTAAWKDLLFNEFHDTLCGTSAAMVLADALDIFGRCRQTARKVAMAAMLALAELDPADDEGIPIYVFNPHASPYRGPVEAELMIDYRPDFSGKVSLEIRDAAGRILPSQEETPTFVLPVDWRKKVVFWDEISPLTCVRYLARRTRDPQPVAGGVQVSESDSALVVNTGRLRVTFDRQSGLMTGLTDLAAGRELLAGPGFAPLVVADDGDTWGARVDAYREVVGRFTAMQVIGTSEVPVTYITGPVRTTVESLLTCDNSTIVARFTFYPDAPYIEIYLRVNWSETQRMLKLSVPTNLIQFAQAGSTTRRVTNLPGASVCDSPSQAAPRVRCEIPYGVIERPADGTEHVGRRWVMLDADGYALGLINTGQYGFDVKDGELRLSLLRSPAYCQMDWGDRKLEPGQAHRFMDQGEHEIRLGVVCGPEPDALRATIQAAEQLNVPLAVLPYSPTGLVGLTGETTVSPIGSFLAVEPETVRLAALKLAEDVQGTIVRLHEAAGQPTHAILTPGDRAASSFEMAPFELRTFRLLPGGRIQETDLLERPMSG